MGISEPHSCELNLGRERIHAVGDDPHFQLVVPEALLPLQRLVLEVESANAGRDEFCLYYVPAGAEGKAFSEANKIVADSETRDGRLLLFEADSRGWIHATDPVDLFPYKPAVMQKAFDGFRTMLLKHMQH